MSFLYQIGDSPFDYGGLTTEQEILRQRMKILHENAKQSSAEHQSIEKFTSADNPTEQKNELLPDSQHNDRLQISPTEFITIIIKSAQTPLDWLILIIVLISIAISLDTMITSLCDFTQYKGRGYSGDNFCRTCGGVV